MTPKPDWKVKIDAMREEHINFPPSEDVIRTELLQLISQVAQQERESIIDYIKRRSEKITDGNGHIMGYQIYATDLDSAPLPDKL